MFQATGPATEKVDDQTLNAGVPVQTAVGSSQTADTANR